GGRTPPRLCGVHRDRRMRRWRRSHLRRRPHHGTGGDHGYREDGAFGLLIPASDQEAAPRTAPLLRVRPSLAAARAPALRAGTRAFADFAAPRKDARERPIREEPVATGWGHDAAGGPGLTAPERTP